MGISAKRCLFSAVLSTFIGFLFGLGSSFAADPQKTDLLWSVCIHAGDVHYNLDEARTAFEQIRDLGATLVRTDFDWVALEPSPGNWDPKAIQFFDGYINEARAVGLDVIAILSQAPDWANQLYKQGKKDEFLTAYRQYAEKVASLYGDRLTYYQYWNESNSTTDMLKYEDRWQLFLTGDWGVRAFNRLPPVGLVNYTVDAFFRFTWKSQLRDTFERINREDPQHTIRTIAIDDYPSTWSLNRYLGGWGPLDDLDRLLTDPTHPCFGFDAAITETGYSQEIGAPYNTYIGRGERAQANWFSDTIPFLQRRLSDFNSHHSVKYRWVGFYELYDGSATEVNPEAHFGLYHADRTPKEAVAVIRSLLVH